MDFNTPFTPVDPPIPSLQEGMPSIMRPNTSRVTPSPEDWERHRPVIKRLFLDENKKLKEVAQIMATQYGHFATPKMYRDRTKKWKIEKKNKESDMLAILRKKNERNAIGKQTAFRVRGQTVTMDQVNQYLRRKRKMIDQEAYDAPTPSDVSYWTPSPVSMLVPIEDDMQAISSTRSQRSTQTDTALFPGSAEVVSVPNVDDMESYQASPFVQDEHIIEMTLKTMYNLLSPGPNIPLSPSTPHALLIPERLLLTIKTHVDRSFGKGTWITNSNGDCVSLMADANRQYWPRNFVNHCCTAAEFLERGLHVDFRRAISKAFGLVKDIIQSEHPEALDLFLNTMLLFIQKQHPEVVKMLRKYLCAVATTIRMENHPWVHISRLIAALEEDTLEQVIIQSWKCKVDGYERALGPFHRTSLSSNLTFIRRVHGSINVVEEERILRELLARCEDGLGNSATQTLSIKIHLGGSLMDQARYAEAEELELRILARAEERDWFEGMIDALVATAESQYLQHKVTLAENNLRRAVELLVNSLGMDDPFTIGNMLRLEGWLRYWGREDEADELKAGVGEAMGEDDIYEELDGH